MSSAEVASAMPQLVIDSGGHKALINDVLFTPDGKELISVSEDKTIRIWDVASGKTIEVLRGHTDFIYAVAFRRTSVAVMGA